MFYFVCAVLYQNVLNLTERIVRNWQTKRIYKMIFKDLLSSVKFLGTEFSVFCNKALRECRIT